MKIVDDGVAKISHFQVPDFKWSVPIGGPWFFTFPHDPQGSGEKHSVARCNMMYHYVA